MAVLGKIRQRVGLLVFIIAAAILAFILMDVTSSSQGVSGNPNAIGSVNGEEISAIEYEERVTNIVNNYQNSGLTVDDRTRLTIREQAWNQYIEDKLTQKELKKLGLNVPDEELKSLLLGDQPHPTIAQAPLFRGENGQFDRNKLRQYVEGFKADNPQAQSQRAQWATFEQSVQKEQARKKYTDMISKAIYVPTKLAEQQNTEKGKKANISYLTVDYATVDDGEITVEERDLKNYLNEHQDEFEAKETRTIEYTSYPIVASDKDDADAKNYVTERIAKFRNTPPEEIERFLKRQYTEIPYDGSFVTKDQITSAQKDTLFGLAVGTVYGPYLENGAYVAAKLVNRQSVADSLKIRVIAVTYDKAGGKDKARTRIDSINNLLDTGGDFEVLASSHSEDESKQTGGELENYIKPGQFPKELNSALFYENKQGARFISPTPNAWYIVEILESLGNNESVQLGYLSKNVEPSKATRDGIYQQASRFAGMNRSVEALRAAAEKEGIQLQTASGLTKNSFEIEGVGVSSDVVAWAFKNNVGDVCERVFQVDDQKDGETVSNYVVVALTGSSPEGTVSLSNPSVKTQVENAVKKQKKAAKIKQDIGSSKDLRSLSQSLPDTKVDTADIDFGSQFLPKIGNEPKVQATVFNIKQGDTEIVEGDKGVYVVKVNSFRAAADSTDVSATQKANAEQLQNSILHPEAGVFKSLVNAAEVDDGRFSRRQ